MKFLNPFFTLALIFTFQACSSTAEKKPKTEQPAPKEEVVVLENFPTGQVISKVLCKNDTTQSYAMYLPKGYDVKKTYPVIYAFDAHSTGSLPVTDYKELAEKYGYIIIGSNNSQNGLAWEQSQAIAARMFSDTKNRIAINTGRIYVMGFSGGARVANALTITDGSINGVICCGAANPATNTIDPRNNYTFFGIAGTGDFNYSEMKKYDMVELAGHNIKHALITFDGKHEWPPVNVMDEAFLWLELNNMRKNPGMKNDSLISKNIADATEKLKTDLKQNKEYDAYELCRKTINYYEILGDLTLFFDTYKKLQTSAVVDKQLKLNEADWAKEEKMKEDYMNNLQTQNYDWWVKDVASMNQQIKSGKDKNEALIKKRVLGYLSLICYMQTSGALKQNNLPAAEYFDRMYILVDPTNSEAHYFNAEIKSKQGNMDGAIKALQESVKNGFADKKRMENDSAFFGLKNDSDFGKVLEKIK